MKRECCICKQHFRYDKVKIRGPHKVQMCVYCLDVIQEVCAYDGGLW